MQDYLLPSRMRTRAATGVSSETAFSCRSWRVAQTGRLRSVMNDRFRETQLQRRLFGCELEKKARCLNGLSLLPHKFQVTSISLIVIDQFESQK